MEDYKKRFLKYMTDLGIDLDTANAELDGQIEMMGDDSDLTDPKDDARECLTYWEE